MHEIFCKEGGIIVKPDDGYALMLALKTVSERYLNSFEKWASSYKPVTSSGFLADQIRWLLEE
jgi:hypothetical protein